MVSNLFKRRTSSPKMRSRTAPTTPTFGWGSNPTITPFTTLTPLAPIRPTSPPTSFEQESPPLPPTPHSPTSPAQRPASPAFEPSPLLSSPCPRAPEEMSALYLADPFLPPRQPTPPLLLAPLPSTPRGMIEHIVSLRERVVDTERVLERSNDKMACTEIENEYLCQQVTVLTEQREGLKNRLDEAVHELEAARRKYAGLKGRVKELESGNSGVGNMGSGGGSSGGSSGNGGGSMGGSGGGSKRSSRGGNVGGTVSGRTGSAGAISGGGGVEKDWRSEREKGEREWDWGLKDSNSHGHASGRGGRHHA